jgi:hypothetical protein
MYATKFVFPAFALFPLLAPFISAAGIQCNETTYKDTEVHVEPNATYPAGGTAFSCERGSCPFTYGGHYPWPCCLLQCFQSSFPAHNAEALPHPICVEEEAEYYQNITSCVATTCEKDAQGYFAYVANEICQGHRITQDVVTKDLKGDNADPFFCEGLGPNDGPTGENVTVWCTPATTGNHSNPTTYNGTNGTAGPTWTVPGSPSQTDLVPQSTGAAAKSRAGSFEALIGGGIVALMGMALLV